MQTRHHRLASLVVALVLLGGVILFLHLAKLAGDAHLDLEELPRPVREALRIRAGDATLVQVYRGPTPHVETYVIAIERPDGTLERLWLTAEGSPWEPEAAGPNPD